MKLSRHGDAQLRRPTSRFTTNTQKSAPRLQSTTHRSLSTSTSLTIQSTELSRSRSQPVSASLSSRFAQRSHNRHATRRTAITTSSNSHTASTIAQSPVLTSHAAFSTAFRQSAPSHSLLKIFKNKSHQTPEAADPNLEPLGATVNLTKSNDQWEMVYDGVVGHSLEYLKKMSIGSLALSLVSFPVIVLFETDAVSPHGKVLLACTTLFFGAGTTALTNTVCTPYVTKAFLSKTNPNILELTTIGFTGKREAFRFHVNEPTTTRVTKPLTTFQHIATGRYFYLNEEMATHPVFGMILPHLFEVKGSGSDDGASSATTKH